jgi:alanine racemase
MKALNLRTWIEIDREAIKQNYRVFRKVIGKKVALAAVIKSNAYGHDLYLYAKELERLGIDLLAVDSLVEGISLRKAGVSTPMLVLGYTLPSLFKKAGEHGIAIAVSTTESLKALESYRGSPLSIHIKVDTGMHRQGFQWHEHGRVMSLLKKLPAKIRVEGLFTHFAEAKKPKDGARTRRQIAEFQEWKRLFEEKGYKLLAHAGATGGTLVYPEAHEDMVRVGIGFYGVWPSAEVRAYRKDITLHPTLSWKAIVSEVKEVKRGESVGYDFTETLKRDSRIAVVPIGYWHGFPRLLSGKAHVLIRGRRAKVLGRVSMDMIVVDVTDTKGARPGDFVTLIGKDGKERIFAEELATHAQTTAYELLTRLNPRMGHVLI